MLGRTFPVGCGRHKGHQGWIVGEPTQLFRSLKLLQECDTAIKVKSLSHVGLFVTPWTVAYQVPPSMGFSRQEHWSGVPLPSPGDVPDPGTQVSHMVGIVGRLFTV